jgi:hypothetical protein
MSADPRVSSLLDRWRQLRDQGRPPSLDELCADCPDLRDVLADCLRCLAKAPPDRYPSARALADDLAGFLAGKGITAVLPSRLRPHRRRLLASLAAAGLVTAAALFGLWWLGRNPGPAAMSGAGSPPATPPQEVAYQGYVDLEVWPRRLRLNDDGALSLRTGDRFRIEAKLDPAEALRQAQLTLYRNPAAVAVARRRGADFTESDLPTVEDRPGAKRTHAPTAQWAAFTFSGVRPVPSAGR